MGIGFADEVSTGLSREEGWGFDISEWLTKRKCFLKKKNEVGLKFEN